ncbi:hypothetical protein COL154_013109 [Colletotrichum chrysophilum]|uniref:uncharacterized protein n=1 Tax=Colletotrichum chrysophilum TaxID=1836956 RepID=UPI0022FFE584|nr:uncharacterized protein COL26b_011876 [Colletotrichum chrysophilum]KAJ0337580.1 hypothetical protein KNSL1_012792 [Colletotrichum chrysophilum]KAJ0350996.1 hypothetical protein COL154_013109 [Colletotrichum chrysophilum]KAJ0365976.1 hypothetical protein COL26b_011876 [Colletotrichum chrysophilum]
MQIAKVAFFLFAAIGVAANPVDVDGSGIDAGVSGGEDMNTLITYTGKCTRGRNYKEDTCKFKGQKGKTTIVRCPRFANQRVSFDTQYTGAINGPKKNIGQSKNFNATTA